jgi:lipopolysaccharide transport system permease protein
MPIADVNSKVSHPLLLAPLVMFGRQRELIRQFSIRSVEERTRGSVFGTLWTLLVPFLMMCLYTLVFGVLFKGSFHPDQQEDPLLFGIGIYIGLAILGLVNEALSTAPTAVVMQPNLVKKVVFPLEVLPLTSVAFPALQMVVGLAVSAVALWIIGYPPTLGWLWIPVYIFPLLLFSIGLSWGLAAISVYFQDTVQVTRILTQVLFWASGIFFAAHTVQAYPLAWAFLKWNPLLLVIDEVRNVMIWNHATSPMRLLYLYLLGYAVFYFGFYVFVRLKKGFADVL